MRRPTKQWLSLILSLLFLLALLPVGTGAVEIVDSGTCGDNLSWSLDSDGTLTVEGTGEMEDYDSELSFPPWASSTVAVSRILILPGLTRIGDYAFSWCSELVSISLPEGVTRIGEGAFAWCNSMTSIAIPNSVIRIDKSAFSFCYSLSSIIIPEGVTFIGDMAFDYCGSLKSFPIPETVSSIGNWAFSACGLQSATIPEGLTGLGEGIFAGCERLEDITIPNSVTRIERSAFTDCDSLADVYYSGSEAEWEAVFIGDNNDPLRKATIHYNSATPGAKAPAPVVQVSNQKLAVDGVAVEIDHYNIDGSNYFKLRDLACILKGTSNAFDVGYDSASRTVTLTTGGVYTPLDTDMQLGTDQSATAVVSNQRITVNGEEVALTAYNIGGSNFFMLRDLAPYLGFGVDYDSATRTALILTK